MMRKSAVLALVLAGSLAAACGKKPLAREEVDRNRILAAILEREDRRMVGADDFLPSNLRLSRYPEVQAWCAVALGRIGDPKALPWLCEALDSPLAEVRASAAFAIGEIEDVKLREEERRAEDPAAAAAVSSLLGDPSPAVRMRAVEALGKMGSTGGAPAIEGILEGRSPVLSPREFALVSAAITALARLRQTSSLPMLRALAESSDPEIQWRALSALVRLRDAAGRPVFLRQLASPHTEVRAYAARGIGVSREPELAGILFPLVGPRDPRSGSAVPLAVRVCALQALGDLANPAAVPSIRSALAETAAGLDDPERTLFAIQAAAALGAMGGTEARDVLGRLAAENGPVSLVALPALARTSNCEPGWFFKAVDQDRFTGPEGKRAWARALGELGGEESLRRLRHMLAEAAEQGEPGEATLVIPGVLEALSKARAPDLQELLPPYLASGDPVIVRTALESYAPPPGLPRPWDAVIRAYTRFAAGQEVEAKVALIHKLESWLGVPEVLECLRGALHDASPNARRAAARLLRLSGDALVDFDRGMSSSRFTGRSYDLAAISRRQSALAAVDTGKGTIEIQLYQEEAPLTVLNFLSLARLGYYDGLSFMRVVPHFVVQGGDPRNDQEGGPGYTIRCEINMRPFERGSVGMALAGKDTGGSQFFITLSPQPHLDGDYTCFGRVIAGMQVVDRLAPGDRIVRIRILREERILESRRF